jgi:DNA repair photolyase
VFVRWENLTIGADEGTRLPGYRDAATVRTFDAPEALKTRFYEVRAKSVLNRVPERSAMPFRWTINPYRGCSHACAYCYARPTHTFLGFDAGRDFEREIVVKVNTPEVLRAELARPSWRGEHVALGTNTDPYQWVEGRYRLMRGVWEALRDAENPCSVLTKSPLLLRDLDLLLEIAAVTDVSAALSVPTIDERAWRATEPHTPNPRARLEAVAELNRAGIPTSVLVAPLMPGINDDPRQVEEILTLAAEAGATNIGGVALHLRGEVRGVFMDWLRSERPDLVARYEELYERGAYAPERERVRLARLIAQGREARPDAFQGKDVFRTRRPDGSLDPAAQARFGPRRGPGSLGAGADGGAGSGDGGRSGGAAGTRPREAPRSPPVQTSLF